MMIRSARKDSALQISTICFCAMLRRETSSSTSSLMCSSSISFFASRRMADQFTRPDFEDCGLPKNMFSAMVSVSTSFSS